MTEDWKDIPGFEGEYQVSNIGQVRSLDREYPQKSRWGGTHIHRVKGKMLKPGLASHGYLTVCLRRNKSYTVHTLVALAFLGECPAGCEVLHGDGSRTNNNVENLRYGTRTENILDAVTSGSWFSDARKTHLLNFGGAR